MSLSVYIAAPCLDGRPFSTHVSSVVSEVAALERFGVRCAYHSLVNFPMIGEGRNVMVRDFLASPHSHLLFWDTDCAISAGAVGQLLLSDKPVVGAIGCKKREAVGGLDDYCALHCDTQPTGNLLRLQFISTQFLLIHRNVFVSLQVAGAGSNWFRVSDPAVGCAWTEDYYFSALARKHGFDIWGHLGIQLTHYGIKGYTAPDYAGMLLRERLAGRVPDTVTQTASTSGVNPAASALSLP